MDTALTRDQELRALDAEQRALEERRTRINAELMRIQNRRHAILGATYRTPTPMRRKDDLPPAKPVVDAVQLRVLDSTPRRLEETVMLDPFEDIPVPMPVTISFGEDL